MSTLKTFMMSLAATTVSIILTFGTSAIIERHKLKSEKRDMVINTIGNILFVQTVSSFYGESFLISMKRFFDQCKLMMKVEDKELEVYSKQQESIMESSSNGQDSKEMNELFQDLQDRRAKMHQAIQEGKK